MALPAFRITLHDGTSYVTNMAAGITLAQATAYFLGQRFTDENQETGEETTRTVIAVEEIAPVAQRLFIGVFPAGISYADRMREEHGDYKRLAFLSYRTLILDIEPDCPPGLRKVIEEDAAAIQARRGENFQVSTSGQTVLLGE